MIIISTTKSKSSGTKQKTLTIEEMNAICAYARKVGFSYDINALGSTLKSAYFHAESPSFPIVVAYTVFSNSIEIDITCRHPPTMTVAEAELFSKYFSGAIKLAKKLHGGKTKSYISK